MDLQNIQNQLNTEFAKSETRIIFWFDDKDIDYINEKVLDTISKPPGLCTLLDPPTTTMH